MLQNADYLPPLLLVLGTFLVQMLIPEALSDLCVLLSLYLFIFLLPRNLSHISLMKGMMFASYEEKQILVYFSPQRESK